MRGFIHKEDAVPRQVCTNHRWARFIRTAETELKSSNNLNFELSLRDLNGIFRKLDKPKFLMNYIRIKRDPPLVALRQSFAQTHKECFLSLTWVPSQTIPNPTTANKMRVLVCKNIKQSHERHFVGKYLKRERSRELPMRP